jgi:hypothetical protein
VIAAEITIALLSVSASQHQDLGSGRAIKNGRGPTKGNETGEWQEQRRLLGIGSFFSGDVMVLLSFVRPILKTPK